MRAVLLLAPLSALAAPAAAQSAPAHAVVFAEAPPQGRTIVRDVQFVCAGTSCAGGRSNSRPAIVCQSLAREFGPVQSFAAAGEAFDAADLERCNARARR